MNGQQTLHRGRGRAAGPGPGRMRAPASHPRGPSAGERAAQPGGRPAERGGALPPPEQTPQGPELSPGLAAGLSPL